METYKMSVKGTPCGASNCSVISDEEIEHAKVIEVSANQIGGFPSTDILKCGLKLQTDNFYFVVQMKRVATKKSDWSVWREHVCVCQIKKLISKKTRMSLKSTLVSFLHVDFKVKNERPIEKHLQIGQKRPNIIVEDHSILSDWKSEQPKQNTCRQQCLMQCSEYLFLHEDEFHIWIFWIFWGACVVQILGLVKAKSLHLCTRRFFLFGYTWVHSKIEKDKLFEFDPSQVHSS